MKRMKFLQHLCIENFPRLCDKVIIIRQRIWTQLKSWHVTSGSSASQKIWPTLKIQWYQVSHFSFRFSSDNPAIHQKETKQIGCGLSGLIVSGQTPKIDAEFVSRAGPTWRSIEETTSTSTERSRHQNPECVSSQSTVPGHIDAPARRAFYAGR